MPAQRAQATSPSLTSEEALDFLLRGVKRVTRDSQATTRCRCLCHCRFCVAAHGDVCCNVAAGSAVAALADADAARTAVSD